MASLDFIYGTVFPIGGIDDNNSYVNLTGGEISSVQLTEPSLTVSAIDVSMRENYDMNNQLEKYAYRIPILYIDDFRIAAINITAFKLSYCDFIPTVMAEFVDTGNDLLSTNVLRDGSLLKVYIGGYGDELYYKPIRQDFIITSVKKTGGNNQNYGDSLRYRVHGKLNVPYGYKIESWSEGSCSAQQELFNLATYTGLGFASNFTKTGTPDTMNWQNPATKSYFEFMESIAEHACYSPSTFFTAFIDQYNVLNFVECHSLLSHGGKKTDTPAMIYVNYPPSAVPPYDPSTGQVKTTDNQLILKEEYREKKENDEGFLNNNYQKISYYFISNNEIYSGWTNFIEEYTDINNGSSSLKDGYVRHLNYIDPNVSGEWGNNNCIFHIRPIDNLKRNSSNQVIENLPDQPTQESYIPLNLQQMTKREYQDINSNDVDDMSSTQSYTLLDGTHNTENLFKLYYFAEEQNKFQMKCMKRCGLQVIMQNYNPAITKFSRIWVDIYDKDITSSGEITGADNDTIERNKNNAYGEYKKMQKENILKFDNEGVIDDIDVKERKNKNWPRGEFNRALSGWYVVSEIEIYYNPSDNNLKMKLILNRIEYQPCFKDEYICARDAVNERYGRENMITNILDLEGDGPSDTPNNSTPGSTPASTPEPAAEPAANKC